MKGGTLQLWRSRPLMSIAVLIIAVTVWHIVAVLGHVSPLVLPAPADVWNELTAHPRLYASDAFTTTTEALFGFCIALSVSLVLAAGMVHFELLERVVEPVQLAIRCTPIVALAPALMLAFGFGTAPKVIMAALMTFAPFLVNAVTGLGLVDEETHEVFRSLGASRLEVFRYLRFPHALPYLFSAARIAVSVALMGAVVAEWSGSSAGLGYRIVSAQKNLDTAAVWAAIMVLAVTGIAATLLVTRAELRFAGRPLAVSVSDSRRSLDE